MCRQIRRYRSILQLLLDVYVWYVWSAVDGDDDDTMANYNASRTI